MRCSGIHYDQPYRFGPHAAARSEVCGPDTDEEMLCDWMKKVKSKYRGAWFTEQSGKVMAIVGQYDSKKNTANMVESDESTDECYDKNGKPLSKGKKVKTSGGTGEIEAIKGKNVVVDGKEYPESEVELVD